MGGYFYALFFVAISNSENKGDNTGEHNYECKHSFICNHIYLPPFLEIGKEQNRPPFSAHSAFHLITFFDKSQQNAPNNTVRG